MNQAAQTPSEIVEYDSSVRYLNRDLSLLDFHLRVLEQAVDPLTDSLRTTADPIMRADVAWALGRIAGPRCIDPLMGMVVEPDPAVRYTAADALARTSNRLLDHRADSASKSRP